MVKSWTGNLPIFNNDSYNSMKIFNMRKTVGENPRSKNKQCYFSPVYEDDINYTV